MTSIVTPNQLAYWKLKTRTLEVEVNEKTDVLCAVQQLLDEGKPIHGSVVHQELNATIKKWRAA